MGGGARKSVTSTTTTTTAKYMYDHNTPSGFFQNPRANKEISKEVYAITGIDIGYVFMFYNTQLKDQLFISQALVKETVQ